MPRAVPFLPMFSFSIPPMIQYCVLFLHLSALSWKVIAIVFLDWNIPVEDRLVELLQLVLILVACWIIAQPCDISADNEWRM